MRRRAGIVLAAVLLATTLVAPTLAVAGAATDAALGLGAFAVFNQIVSGTGIFHREPEPQVVVVSPPRAPVVVYEYQYYYPAPRVHHVYRYEEPRSAWCPPGLAKKGRCFARHHGHGHDE